MSAITRSGRERDRVRRTARVIDTLHWRHLWIVAALIWAGAMTSDCVPQERLRKMT